MQGAYSASVPDPIARMFVGETCSADRNHPSAGGVVATQPSSHTEKIFGKGRKQAPRQSQSHSWAASPRCVNSTIFFGARSGRRRGPQRPSGSRNGPSPDPQMLSPIGPAAPAETVRGREPIAPLAVAPAIYPRDISHTPRQANGRWDWPPTTRTRWPPRHCVLALTARTPIAHSGQIAGVDFGSTCRA